MLVYSSSSTLLLMVLKSIGFWMMLEYPGAMISLTGKAKNPCVSLRCSDCVIFCRNILKLFGSSSSGLLRNFLSTGSSSSCLALSNGFGVDVTEYAWRLLDGDAHDDDCEWPSPSYSSRSRLRGRS